MNRLSRVETGTSDQNLLFSDKEDQKKRKYKSNTSDDGSKELLSWFRQQGGTVTKGSSSKNLNSNSNSNFTLPKLPGSQENELKRKNKKRDKRFNQNSYASFNSTSMASLNSNETREIKTPIPGNSFYLKCINDVSKSNLPQTQKFTEPRELKYVQSIPFFKYVTFGSGKSFNCVWQIQTISEQV